MRTIVDSMPAMVNVKAGDGRYVLMNHYQVAIYGVTPDEAMGRTAGELLGADYGAATHALDRRVLEFGSARGGLRADLRRCPRRDADVDLDQAATVRRAGSPVRNHETGSGGCVREVSGSP
ncbi:MAG: hypothetical protein FJX36_17355 [Alphaproteobacteria bacterium]|nr:hypothetical protein [Alphaproteobacteria bacterium]